MALIKEDVARSSDASTTQTMPEPDYAAEADQSHLKLREDELLRNSSRLHPQRTMWDTIVSGAGAVVAVALIVIGAAAVYGGNFGRDNVQDRLAPEKVVFPPMDAMTPAEQQELGQFAGQTVDTGPEAEGFARYIGGHLAEVNEGATYSETSSAAREEGLDAEDGGRPAGEGRHPVQGRDASIDPAERLRMVDGRDDRSVRGLRLDRCRPRVGGSVAARVPPRTSWPSGFGTRDRLSLAVAPGGRPDSSSTGPPGPSANSRSGRTPIAGRRRAPTKPRSALSRGDPAGAPRRTSCDRPGVCTSPSRAGTDGHPRPQG